MLLESTQAKRMCQKKGESKLEISQSNNSEILSKIRGKQKKCGSQQPAFSLCIAQPSGNLKFETQKTACKGNKAIRVYFIVSLLSPMISLGIA